MYRNIQENVGKFFDILEERCQNGSIFTFILGMREKLRFIYQHNAIHTHLHIYGNRSKHYGKNHQI